jgi:hypothetical protein
MSAPLRREYFYSHSYRIEMNKALLLAGQNLLPMSLREHYY